MVTERRTVFVGFLAILAACGGGGTCEEAIANIERLKLAELAGEERAAAAERSRANHARAIEECKKAKMSAKQLYCLASAKSLDEAPRCVATGSDVEEYQRYIAKSKTAEALEMVRRLYLGARAYYEEEPLLPDGTFGERQFPSPPAESIQPPLGTCCRQGGKCSPDAARWQDPAWQALRFSVDDPHYYSYRYTAEGVGKNARFTASAYGDLDCDGEYSTFEMIGSIGEDGEVTSGAEVFKESELE